MATLTTMAAIEATANGIGLSWVPDVVTRLTRLGLSIEQAKIRLVEAAQDGAIELRPESGLGRCTPSEIAAMPVGFDGCRLSWARAV